MHFEILVEGQTELTALSILMRKIIGEYAQPHTWKIHKHRGIGCLPNDPGAKPDKNDRTLLHNLPAKLRAYGKDARDDVVVVVLVDLDDRPSCIDFKSELTTPLSHCPRQPKTLFRIAIEELEAWFLGDREAIIQAYPDADLSVLDNYDQDSICGTWEKLADLVHPEGMAALARHGRRSPLIGQQKNIWAKTICPVMDVERNASPSFGAFRDGIRRFST